MMEMSCWLLLRAGSEMGRKRVGSLCIYRPAGSEEWRRRRRRHDTMASWRARLRLRLQLQE
jgi:hypothetical protein